MQYPRCSISLLKLSPYMISMGVDPALLQLSLKYEADDVRYLSGSEMREYRVTTATGGTPVDNQGAAASIQPSQRPTSSPENAGRKEIPVARTGRVLHPRAALRSKAICQMVLPTSRGWPTASPFRSSKTWIAGTRCAIVVWACTHTWVYVDQYESGPYGAASYPDQKALERAEEVVAFF